MKIGDVAYTVYLGGAVELYIVKQLSEFSNPQVQLVANGYEIFMEKWRLKPAKDYHIKKYLAQEVKRAYIEKISEGV